MTGFSVIIAVTVIYIATVFFVPYPALQPILNAVRFIICFAVVLTYFPALLSSSVEPVSKAQGVTVLLIGIGLAWLSGAFFSASNDMNRILGLNTYILTNVVTGYFGVMMVLAGVFHLAAPGFAKPFKVFINLLVAILLFAIFRITLYLIMEK